MSGAGKIAFTMGVCAALAPAARAQTTLTIAPTLLPERLGAKAALRFTVRYTEAMSGVPVPVRHVIVRFPAGMSISVPSLHSCSVARLRAHGAGGCTGQSLLGTGQALAEIHFGALIETEDVSLRLYLGPPDNLTPTFAILAQGYTPLERRFVFTGAVSEAAAPYGEELVMSIPPVPTLVLAPDASVARLTLTVGQARRGSRGSKNVAVTVPRRCPAGGFPFAVESTYADGTSSLSTTEVPCPR